MTTALRFRPGDVLSIAVPFTECRVERGLTFHEVHLAWPWWRPDPGCEFIHWNGVVGLGADHSGTAPEWGMFRTDPAPEHLRAGDLCRVGVPPTVVHVTAVEVYDPPRETGYLPRERACVSLLPRGRSYREYPDHTHLNGEGHGIDPDDGIPYAIDLIHRPYAFLEPGDEVADAAGRAWRFDGPWDWHAFDPEEAGRVPAWPLELLTRDGLPRTEQAAAEVGRATADGSHRGVLHRWTGLTDASPTPSPGGLVLPR
ncbi:hypothetical protein [Streptomyces abyssomicinicus]|uniref:hypothetical protein n=1 Tax=Streptomyces abyssomicinicus TaxID=574929 RepID=UPI00124FB147|nr:hypothetical protein [Streptomyces abyssomicinicus]